MKDIFCTKCQETIEMEEEYSLSDSFDPSSDSHVQSSEPYYICPQCGCIYNAEGEFDYEHDRNDFSNLDEPDEIDTPDIDDEDVDNL